MSPKRARTRQMFVALMPLVAAHTAAASSADRLARATQTVTDDFHRRMADHKIAGGALVVMGPHRTYVEAHHGFADVERGVRADEGTIYSWGSVTKTLTSIAIMQLELRGKLALEDAYVDYVPTFSRIDNPHGGTESITIRMLLSHTAGLQNPSYIIPLSPHTHWPDWPQVLAAMDYIKVLDPPGSRYRYSNLSLMLAGRLIDEVTEDEYETYMDKNLYKPLEMHESYHDVAPYHLAPRRAQGYLRFDEANGWQSFGPDYDQGATTSNGGLMASVRDMKKYARFLLGSHDEVEQQRHERILPRETLESMWEAVQPLDPPARGNVGLGFHIFEDLKHTYIGHGGSGNGFRCEVVFEPLSRTAILIVGNTDNLRDVQNAVRKTIDETLIPALRSADTARAD